MIMADDFLKGYVCPLKPKIIKNSGAAFSGAQTKKNCHHVAGIYPNKPPPWRQRQHTYTPTTLLLHILTTMTMFIITKHLINNNTSYLSFTYKNHVPQGDNYHYNPLTKTIATPTSVSTKPTTSNVPITYYHSRHTNENHLPSIYDKHTSSYHEISPTKTNPTKPTQQLKYLYQATRSRRAPSP